LKFQVERARVRIRGDSDGVGTHASGVLFKKRLAVNASTPRRAYRPVATAPGSDTRLCDYSKPGAKIKTT